MMSGLNIKSLSKNGFHFAETGEVLDMVCGMELPGKTDYKLLYKGKLYYFCSDNCLKHFKNNPEKYSDD